MQLTDIRHAWPEKADFSIRRPYGCETYTFLHFFNSVELTVNGVTTVTQPHACVLYAPHSPQYFRSRTPLLHDWFHFVGDDAVQYIPTDTVLYPAGADFITAIVAEMETAFAAARPLDDRLIALKCEELFLKLARAAAAVSVTADAATEERFRRLRAAMLTHLGEQWSTARMADAVGLSASRFFSVYRMLYGRTPTEDLITARMDTAKAALAFGNRSIGELAQELGYANASHFSRQFFSRVGMSPRDYRRSKQH